MALQRGQQGRPRGDGRLSHIRTCQRCRALELGLAKGVRQRLGQEGACLLISRELLSCRTWKPFQVVQEEHTICFYLWLI